MTRQEVLDNFDQFCAIATEEDHALYNRASELYWSIEPYLITPESVLLSVGRAHALDSQEAMDAFLENCKQVRRVLESRL